MSRVPTPRLVGVLAPPDIVSLINAGLGFGSVVLAAAGDVENAARLVLLAGIADGVDGILARHGPTSEIGTELDSLCDAVSFGIAPAFLIYVISRPLGRVSYVPIVFVLAAVVRLAVYNVYDSETRSFRGVPSTLSSVIVATLYLTGATTNIGVGTPVALVVLSVVFSYLMLTGIRYPELKKEHAVSMGVVMVLAALFPDYLGSVFGYTLLSFLGAYLMFSPWFYEGAQETEGSGSSEEVG
ncbi:MAG: CDP-alcohol phosphatidyltransferase family protein, partial [Halobacteria archaeon]|nr:CDP-alcohol phosphatidyltransferase family protein [Halobacteria archaeon]